MSEQVPCQDCISLAICRARYRDPLGPWMDALEKECHQIYEYLRPNGLYKIAQHIKVDRLLLEDLK